MNKQQAIERVQMSAGSLYTREDVISLLQAITTSDNSDKAIVAALKRILDLAENVKECIKDFEQPDQSWVDYQLSIDSSNTITVDCLTIDTNASEDTVDTLTDAIKYLIADVSKS